MEDILSVIESKAVEKLKKSAFAKEHPNCLVVEVGEDIGIRAKDDVSSSLAARYAKAYSERMSTVNPEFE